MRSAWRISRARASRPRNPSQRVWTSGVTALLLGGLCLTLLATFADGWVTWRVATTRSPVMEVLKAITDVALVQWYLWPAAVALLLLACLDWNARPPARRAQYALVFGQAAYAFAAISIAQLAARLVKFAVGRGRPDTFDLGGPFHFEAFARDDLYWSFPSGHSTTAGVLAVIAAIWFPRWRAAAFAAGIVLGVSRIAAEAHYPSDVAAGLTLGSVVAVLIARWLASRRLVFRFRDGRLLPVPRFLPVRLRRVIGA